MTNAMHRSILPLKKRLAGVTWALPSTPPAPASCDEKTPAAAGVGERALSESADARAFHVLVGSLSEVVVEARGQRQGLSADLAQMSVELAVAIAERLLGAAIVLDRQRLDQIVATSLERIQPAGPIAVKAHPDDLVLLQRQLEENASLERWRESLTFQADDACERGRLKLEADDLFVEWDTQRSLVELRGLLLDEIFTDA